MIYRKRLIPNELVKLDNDEVVYKSDNIIVTKWKPIKKRSDIGGGESCYLIDRGIKVSRFYDTKGSLTFWYCDIISTEYIKETDEYVFTDLLVDVKVYENGFSEVLDVDELAYALDIGIMDENMLKICLKNLGDLLNVIYNDSLYNLCGRYLDMAR